MGRAKIRYGSFHFQIQTFDRDQMFSKSNSSEIVHSTSSCTRNVFNEEDSNSIIRKTVQRTNIRLHVVSHPLQVLIQRCPFFKETKQLGGESDLSGIRRPGCGRAAESADSKRNALQDENLQKTCRGFRKPTAGVPWTPSRAIK